MLQKKDFRLKMSGISSEDVFHCVICLGKFQWEEQEVNRFDKQKIALYEKKRKFSSLENP